MSNSNPRKRPKKKGGLSRLPKHQHKRLHRHLDDAMIQAKKGNGTEMRFWLEAARKVFPHLPARKLSNILNTYAGVVGKEQGDSDAKRA